MATRAGSPTNGEAQDAPINGNGAAQPRTWNEAPASASVKATVRGRDTMFTLRGESGAELLPKLMGLMDWLDSQTVRDHDGAKLCPVHGARLQPSKFEKGKMFCPAKTGDGDGRCQYTASDE